MKRKGIKNIILLMLTSLSAACFCGCGKEQYPDEKQILKEIPEDKKLVIYTSHKKEVYEPVISEFEERTGIWIDVHTGGTMELMEEIRSSENTEADIMFGGGVESYETFRDCFEVYSCKEKDKIKKEFRNDEDIWTSFTELPIVFIYNEKLVSEEMVPKCWNELLELKWTGKIAFADPLNSGSSCTALETMVKVTGDKDIIEKFYNHLVGRQSPGSGYVIDEVSKGRALIGITLEETALKAIDAGRDIEIVYPEDGTSAIPDGCAVVKNAFHQENARLFIDFIISSDVQNLASKNLYRRSVRNDIVDEKENINIVNFNIKEAVYEQKQILEQWKRLNAGKEKR